MPDTQANSGRDVVLDVEFNQPLDDQWLLEGDGRAAVVDGRLVLQQADGGPGTVLWHRQALPRDFRASFSFSTNNTHGLLIVFFCAQPTEPGADLFDTAEQRAGNFVALTREQLASYHLSLHRYFPNGKQNPDQAANLRKNPAFEVVANYVPDPAVTPNTTYEVAIEKRGNRIRTWVDGQLLHDYTDEGELGEPLHGGHLGLRVRGNGEFEAYIDRLTISSL